MAIKKAYSDLHRYLTSDLTLLINNQGTCIPIVPGTWVCGQGASIVVISFITRREQAKGRDFYNGSSGTANLHFRGVSDCGRVVYIHALRVEFVKGKGGSRQGEVGERCVERFCPSHSSYAAHVVRRRFIPTPHANLQRGYE